jgi:hypothetical protein
VHVSCIQSLHLLLHPLLPGSRFLFVSIITHLFSAFRVNLLSHPLLRGGFLVHFNCLSVLCLELHSE